MGEMRMVKLSDLLTPDQLRVVSRHLKFEEWTALKTYLRSIEDELRVKGVLADYLFYVLQSDFGGK